MREIIGRITESKLAILGACIILLWIVVAIAAPIIAPYSPVKLIGSRLQSPSIKHLLGTDHLGRDVFSRLIWGTRVVVRLAPIAVFIGEGIGLTLGLLGGYFGGRLDNVIMRFCDVLLSFPRIPLYLVVIMTFGPSRMVVVTCVALSAIPVATRLVRSMAIDAMTEDYVQAARLRGERLWYTLFREILPNISGPLIADACIRIGYGIMAIGTLGFLGLGLPPPWPNWGGMIDEGRDYMMIMPWSVLAPAFSMSSVVIALNLIDDAIEKGGREQ